MKIKILADGPYSDFDSDPPAKAVKRKAGDIVDVPQWYGQALINAGLAEEPEPEPAIVEERPTRSTYRARKTSSQ